MVSMGTVPFGTSASAILSLPRKGWAMPTPFIMRDRSFAPVDTGS